MLFRQLTSPITFNVTQSIVGVDGAAPLPNGTITVASRGSVWFDGVDDGYTYADSSRFDFPDADWFFATLVQLTVNTGTRYIASIGTQGGNHNLQLYTTNTSNIATVTAQVRGATPAIIPVAGTTLAQDGWYVMGVQRTGGNVQIFTCPLNGTATFGTPLVFTTATAITPSGTHWIGARSSFQANTWWQNNISYVVKGSGTLSADDVQALAAGTDPLSLGKSLDIYTRFDAADATINNSVMGNNDPATRVSTPRTRGGPDWSGLGVRIDGVTTKRWGRVWQRQGASRAITFTGTYRGSPSGLEARIIGNDNAQVLGWTNCTPTGVGTWSVQLTVPQGLSDYILEVRHKDTPAVISRTFYPFGVGDIIMYTGQSNANNMATSGSRTLDMRKHCLYTGNPGSFRDTRVTNLGCGFGEVMFQYQDALEASGQTIPIMVCNTSASGSSLTAQPNGWQDTSGTVWAGFLSGLAAVGGDVAAIIWHQGEADAGANVAGSLYGSTLQTVVGRMRTNVGRDANNLPFFPWVLGHAGGTTAAPDNWRPIRNELINAVSTIPNSRTTGGAYVLDLVDSLHYVTTQNGYVDLGCMNAQALANYFLPTSYSTGMEGPFVTSASIFGNDIILSFNLNGNSGLFLPIASPSPVDGLVVRNGSAVLQTVSSWAISGNTLVLTMASTPVAGWTVDYIPKDILRTSGAYAITDNDNMIYGTNTVIGTTRRVPARPMTAAITL
jgi:hypothetical protein